MREIEIEIERERERENPHALIKQVRPFFGDPSLFGSLPLLMCHALECFPVMLINMRILM